MRGPHLAHQPELHAVLAHHHAQRDGRDNPANRLVRRQDARREGPFDPGLRIAHLADVKQELTHLAPFLMQAQTSKYTTGPAPARVPARPGRPAVPGVKTPEGVAAAPGALEWDVRLSCGA